MRRNVHVLAKTVHICAAAEVSPDGWLTVGPYARDCCLTTWSAGGLEDPVAVVVGVTGVEALLVEFSGKPVLDLIVGHQHAAPRALVGRVEQAGGVERGARAREEIKNKRVLAITNSDLQAVSRRVNRLGKRKNVALA